MKRLVFGFDGTWNHLDSVTPTNVVIVAQSITPLARDGTIQIIHYDPGVGTGSDDHLRGGLFGEGLLDKIIDAYTFLVFNYEPGDEVFVFGFSRGAFTARAFIGFIKNLGIIQRNRASRIADAVRLYKAHKAGGDENNAELLQFRWENSPEICVNVAEDQWRAKTCAGYRTGDAAIFNIRYLGVWDTVAALGVPSDIVFAKWANAGEQYFDSDLSPIVVSSRHAVSIDEDRVAFTPTLWPNFKELNEALGYAAFAADAPYQQKWWPGDHGSVGGGGDIRGLSDGALSWVLDGALLMDLEVDKDPGSPLFELMPRPFDPLKNAKSLDPTFLGILENAAMSKKPRAHGPTAIEEVSDSALLRWRAEAAALPERKLYRPVPLEAVAGAIDAGTQSAGPQSQSPQPDAPGARSATPGSYYRVAFGDDLGRIAEKAYGHASATERILQANRTITNADRIYVGQTIFLPNVTE